jgi:hypothetical protein
MEPTDFKPGTCYTVFFEKDIPIEFKFLKTTIGRIVCEKQNGKRFNFNELPQYLSIREMYPGW